MLGGQRLRPIKASEARARCHGQDEPGASGEVF